MAVIEGVGNIAATVVLQVKQTVEVVKAGQTSVLV